MTVCDIILFGIVEISGLLNFSIKCVILMNLTCLVCVKMSRNLSFGAIFKPIFD